VPHARPRLTILYGDEKLVVVDKPSGLVVHRSTRASDSVNCLTLLRDQLGRWVYPVHRLDRGTSGVLVFGLSSGSARALASAWADGGVEKAYVAVVRGWVECQGDIDYALPPDEGKPRAPSRTLFRRVAQVELPHRVGRYATARYSLLELRPLTGRLHQLRRHMAHVRHPIVGDVAHGDGDHNRFFRSHLGSRRLLLHSHAIRLRNPTSSGVLDVRAPLDEEMERVLDALGMGEAGASAVRSPWSH